MLGAALVYGQSEFEAVSVKPYRPRGPISEGCNSHSDPLLTVLTGCTLKQLVILAYDLKNYQLQTRGSAWIETEKYVIQARSAMAASEAERMRMLQPVLVSRFHLIFRRQPRDGPVLLLQLTSHEARLQPASNTKQCGSLNVRQGTLKSDCLTLDDFAEALQEFVFKDRPVLNRTGLGKERQYKFSLEYSAEDDASSGPAAAPSIFSALPDQLGLTLKAGKAPIDTLLIERAAHPEPN